MAQDLLRPDDSSCRDPAQPPEDAAFKSAEAERFERLYRERRLWVRKLLLHCGAKTQEAEDLAQQVFLNLLAASTPLSSIRSVNTYLRRIATRVLCEAHGKQARDNQHVVIDSELVEEDGVDNACRDELDTIAASQELERIAAPFSESERMVLFLKLEGLSAPEMARRSGLTLDQIERRLTKVNERLEIIRSQRNARMAT